MIRFLINGETPPKKNSKIITKSGAIVPSKRYKDWHTGAMLQMNAQLCRMGKARQEAINTPVTLSITFYHGDLVRRDSDNQASSILDLLQDAKVLADDRWQIVRKIQIVNLYEKKQARCLIEISGFEEK